MEDLADMQKKLLDKMRTEVKTLNEQLEVLVLRYRNDTEHLKNECDELNGRLKRYEERLNENEEQNVKYLNLVERLKSRLRELTAKVQEEQDEVFPNRSILMIT